MHKQAIILLHEIYGVNEFMQYQRRRFTAAGFDVFCPNLIRRPSFSYEESQQAYNYFMEHIGFDVYKQVDASIKQLKERYRKVFLVGFSIGATVAFRCCENTACDGIAACYGSRIRDYLSLNPVCPTLLLFSQEASFDVGQVSARLKKKPCTNVLKFSAGHGFMDKGSKNYDKTAAKSAEDAICGFFQNS